MFFLVAAPLFAITRNIQHFLLNDDCQGDFDWLMVVLTAVPLLSLLVNDAVYLLKFDAADIAIGELLSVILAEETHRFLYRPYK